MPSRPAESLLVLLLDACQCKNLHRFYLHPPGSDLPQSLSVDDLSPLTSRAQRPVEQSPAVAAVSSTVCVCVCVQTLQDKVCELQACFGSEEVSCQQTGGGAWAQGEEPLLPTG